MLGKTNLSEFCCFYDSDNRVYGRTGNPHDPERTPGGSSGGEAAAVAAGLSPLGLGSDLGSSIRQPAAWCGVFGLKPTRGLVPIAGHAGPGLPPALRLFASIGPLARSAADLELGLRAMAIAEPAPARPGPLPVASTRRTACRPVAQLLPRRRCGARRTRSRPPATSWSRPRRRGRPRRATPTTSCSAASSRSTCLPLVGGREDELSRYGREMVEQLRGFSPGLGAYLEAGRPLAEVDAQAGEWLERHPLALCPTVPVTRAARRRGHRRRSTASRPAPAASSRSARTPTRSGCPPRACPAGRDEDGLPLAVQVIADRGRDLDVLVVAAELEEALGGALDPAESPLSPLR